MKKWITVLIVSCYFAYHLPAQKLELVSATERLWDYTPGTSHGRGPFPVGMKYCFNFCCDDFNCMVVDSVYIGSDKSSVCYGNSNFRTDGRNHVYTLLFTGQAYFKNPPPDRPVIIIYEYNDVKYSQLVENFTELAPSSQFKCGVR